MFKYPMLLTKKEDDHRGANQRAQERPKSDRAWAMLGPRRVAVNERVACSSVVRLTE